MAIKFGDIKSGEDAKLAVEQMKRKMAQKNEPVPGYLVDDAPAKPDVPKSPQIPAEKATRPEIPKPSGQGGGKKVMISIHLSPEVVDYFRATGRDWQPRINQVLLDHIRREE